MGKWSDTLLDIEPSQPQEKEVKENPQSKVKWSDVLTNDLGPQDQFIGDNPLSSVMNKELFKDQKDPASFGTQFLAGFADDPQTKLRVYAATRFPNIPEQERLKRYGIDNGEIVYMGDDGNLYRETPDTWLQKVKRFSAETGAHAPAIIMSIIGSLGGPGLAALGAAGGEGIRKTVGATVLDEPQTTTGNVLSMAGEGGTAYLGDVGGRLIGRGINKLGAMRGGKLASQAGPLRGEVNLRDVLEMENIGKEFGVDLYPPQTTGSKRLADKFNLLGDLESSAPIIQTARKKQVEQIDNAVYNFLDTISSVKEPTSKTGQRLVDAAQKSLKGAANARKVISSPIYKKAFKEAGEVDVKPVISWIDNELKTAKGGVRQNLLKAKKLIQKPDLPKRTEASKLVDLRGQPLTKATTSYETSLKGLHDAKMAIDDEIAKAAKARTGNVKRNYQEIKTRLLDQMDKASPDYAKARNIYSSASEVVDELGKKTILGDVAKLEGDKVVNATRKFLASPEVKRAPEIARKVRNIIMKQDPQAWDNAVAAHLQDLFESTKQSVTGGITNVGGHFYKKVWGDRAQREVLKKAMSPESYNTLKRFMKILERSGMILGKESATATRQVMLEEMQGKALGRVVRAATRPLYTKERLLGDRLLESVLSKNAKNLANAMTSEKAASQLKRMYQLSPTSQKLLPAVTNFLGMVISGDFSRERKRKKQKDTLPERLRTPLKYRLTQ